MTTHSWRNFSVLNTTRGLFLMGLGAIVGLVFAGIGLFTAEGTTTLYVPPEDVAVVNQQPISRSDYYAQIKLLFDVDYAKATPEQRKKALDDMIREELFVQRGNEIDVAVSDPSTRSAMVSAVEQTAMTDAMTEVPSDETLRAFYEENKPRYSSEGYMSVRHLIFPAGTSAQNIAAARALSPDQAIARFGAKDSGNVAADEFYFAADIHLGKELAAKAKALNDGQVTEPVTQADGIHVAYVIKNVRPVAIGFETAKSRILTDYRRENAKRRLANEEEFLKKRANILLAEDVK